MRSRTRDTEIQNYQFPTGGLAVFFPYLYFTARTKGKITVCCPFLGSLILCSMACCPSSWKFYLLFNGLLTFAA